MAKKQKTDETETMVDLEAGAVEARDPNQVVTLDVYDLANAGREPSTRWGRVKFDAEGHGTVKLPMRDIPALHSLGWMSDEDKDEYLGIAQDVQTQAVSLDDLAAYGKQMQEMQTRLTDSQNQLHNAQLALDAQKISIEKMQAQADGAANAGAKLISLQTEFDAYKAKVAQEAVDASKALKAAK